MCDIMNILSKFKGIIAFCIIIFLIGIVSILMVKNSKLNKMLLSEMNKDPEKVYVHDVEIRNIEKEVIVEKEVEVERDVPDSSFFKNVLLNADCILQLPELPTGCEVTSLAIILNYYGYSIDKLTLADEYLPKGEIGETCPYEAFVGDPRNDKSYGAYAPVLVETANLYLETQDSILSAKDITGSTMADIREYLRDGFPVMVWVTVDMKKPKNSAEWHIDGNEYTWIEGEHCIVLIGFTDSTYIAADPLKGIVEYNKEILTSRFKEMGKQAIVIK